MSSSSYDIKYVKGDAPDETKERACAVLRRLTSRLETGTRGFSDHIGKRIKVTEVSIRPNKLAPKRVEATVVCELEVKEDMLNGGGNIHGGCSAYLIDMCTTLPLAALPNGAPGVSQAINMIYHSPAPLGTQLRIISTSVAVGGRAMTSRGELWDTKNARLVASGVHIKMLPSQPKPKL